VPLLADAGFATSAPTLTGCGERRHLLSRAVTLDTHVQDVVQHIEAEELDGIILVAHSYGGFVAAGVAEAIAPRIGQLILLDAFAPNDGECVLDYAGDSQKANVIAAAEQSPTFNLAPARAAALGITNAADAAWIDRRTTPHPVGTYLQPVKLARGLGAIGRKAYLACDQAKLAVFDGTKRRISRDPAWRYVSLETSHDAMVASPAALASAIVDLVA
jgi:pimeloyl-ACP methyl ester carboxylesterase